MREKLYQTVLFLLTAVSAVLLIRAGFLRVRTANTVPSSPGGVETASASSRAVLSSGEASGQPSPEVLSVPGTGEESGVDEDAGPAGEASGTASGGQGASGVSARGQNAEPVRIPVLMYHQFSEKPARFSPWCMPVEELRADLEYLRDNGYTTILPSELLEALEGSRTLPEKPVILTFDDGHETMYASVLPLLEEFDMKAVANVVGSYCDLYSEQEDHTLDYSSLTWEEVGELYASGRVEIGSHSYDLHDNTGRKGIRILPGEDPVSYREMLTRDTLACQRRIQEATGVRPVVYAFPFGYTCPEAEKLLAGLGYTVLLGCQGKVNLIGADAELPVRLERFNRPQGVTARDFFKKLGA